MFNNLTESSEPAKERTGSMLPFYRGGMVFSGRLTSCPKLHSCSCMWESPRSDQLQSPCSKAHAVNAYAPKPQRPPNRTKCPVWASAELLWGRPSQAARAQLSGANHPAWLEHRDQNGADHGVNMGLARWALSAPIRNWDLVLMAVALNIQST